MWTRWWTRPVARLALMAPLLGPAAAAQAQLGVASPDGRNVVTVEIRDGTPYYSLQRDGRAVLLPSLLGVAFQGAPALREGLRVADTTRRTVDETWTQPWGEVARVRDVAEIYADGPGAHWLNNPLPVTISQRPVTSATRLRIDLAPGGGQAVRIRSAR